MFAEIDYTYLGPVVIIIQLIFLEGILSIDNAAVLGAMVSTLPDDQPVPYPNFLRFLRPFTDCYLGMQRAAALKVGLLGAYLGRGVMILAASYVITNPWLRLAGAIYLVWLGIENLGILGENGSEKMAAVPRVSVGTFWLVVFNVELADLAFSIDNVVAAVALSNRLWVIMLGVAMGIITIRFAAGIFSYLIRLEPILEKAAYILVLAIGLELLLDELYGLEFSHLTKFAISFSILGVCVLYNRVKFLHVFAPVVYLLGRGMGLLIQMTHWFFKPIQLWLNSVFNFLRQLFTPAKTEIRQSR